MKEFTRKYESRIHGVLSCFDRMLFRGYLPIMSGWAMAGFLYRLKINFGSLKPFLLENSERVKDHAEAMAFHAVASGASPVMAGASWALQ